MYESAPATKLVATNCACCGRPLVDAVSVETGMGPHCRKKHGFAQADTEVEIVAVVTTLAATLPADVYAAVIPSAGQADMARVAVNRLVHRIACLDDAAANLPLWIAMVNAVRELGFVKLADRIAQRWTKIRIEEDSGTYVVRTPFNEELLPLMRAIRGRRWAKPVNIIPTSERAQLWAALRKCFAGRVAIGPKGLFVVA